MHANNQATPISKRPIGLYVLYDWALDDIYGPEEREAISRFVKVVSPNQTKESVLANPECLKQVEVIFSGWGAPLIDYAFLEAAPNLKAVFYASGSVKEFVTDEFWARGIRLSGANSVFVRPVAEFTLSQILFCLKHGWQFALETKRKRAYAPHHRVPGAFGATVGLVSLGEIARKVLELLRPFDLKVIAYDPYVSQDQANELGVDLVSLEELFAKSDVVSVHTPWLPETEKMIGGREFALMKNGASFINTARGAVVDEVELAEVFRARPDLFAMLDVTWPEPPSRTSPLYDLPNVMITPHIAGCMSLECRRGGRFVAEELGRYVRGEKLLGEITSDRLALMGKR